MIRKTMIVAAMAVMTISTAACNTVRGVGDDLNSAADAVDAET